MPRPPLSVTIIAKNEASKIEECIRSVLGWAEDVLVIDSESSDETVLLSEKLGARCLTQKWLGYGAQKNFAQKHAKFDWVFNLDADERATPELKSEIDRLLSENPSPRFFSFPRKNHYLGRWIRYGGWYPNRLSRLGHRSISKWTEPEVHEALVGTGSFENSPPELLQSPIEHFGFDTIQDQLFTNAKYSKLGAIQLMKRGEKGSLPLLLLKPLSKFFETFVLKQGFRDGLPGFIISINAAYSVFMKFSFLIEERIKRHAHTGHRQ